MSVNPISNVRKGEKLLCARIQCENIFSKQSNKYPKHCILFLSTNVLLFWSNVYIFFINLLAFFWLGCVLYGPGKATVLWARTAHCKMLYNLYWRLLMFINCWMREERARAHKRPISFLSDEMFNDEIKQTFSVLTDERESGALFTNCSSGEKKNGYASRPQQIHIKSIIGRIQ